MRTNSWGVGGALRSFAPELRIVDRGLILGVGAPLEANEGDASWQALGELTVDYVAVDAKGRLNLVVWLGTDRDALPAEPVDLALELLHRAQEQSPFILRHLEAMGVRCHGDLRLVLISDHFLESTVRKLAVLGPARLRLIEVHEVRSSSGASHHLVHRFPLQEEQLVGPEEFLDRLPAAPREVAAFVLERLRFIDDRVDLLACNSEALEWTFDNQPLCAIEAAPGALQARVGMGERLALDGMPAAEGFLDQVLQRYFDLRLAEPDEGEPAGPPALVDQGMKVVLSSEEMDAFL
ncbi:MAG: hypothetical protein R3F17_05775 [Planctomycetota bacterium]